MKRSKFVFIVPFVIFSVVLFVFSMSTSRVAGKGSGLMPYPTLTVSTTPSGKDSYGYSFCTSQNGTCSLLGSGYYSVRYGTSSQAVYKTLSGSFTCNDTTFPNSISGTKQCSYLPAPRPGTSNWTICAKENGASCTFTGPSVLAFGTINSSINTYGIVNVPSGISGSVACTSQNFNNTDPAPGVRKVCMFASAPSGPATTAVWSLCAAEGGTCSNTGRIYAFGSAAHTYVYKRFDQIGSATDTSFTCGNAAFGATLATGGNNCYTIGRIRLDSGGWVQCGQNNGTCYIDGSRMVAYGTMASAGNAYVYARVTGEIACNATTFGSDPAPGLAKACYAYQVVAP